MSVAFSIELEQEVDGRWIAEVVELPGVMAYGATQEQAIAQAQALAIRLRDRDDALRRARAFGFGSGEDR